MRTVGNATEQSAGDAGLHTGVAAVVVADVEDEERHAVALGLVNGIDNAVAVQLTEAEGADSDIHDAVVLHTNLKWSTLAAVDVLVTRPFLRGVYFI